MSIYAISDLHLSISSNKPMDVFGGEWEGYLEKIAIDWLSKVKPEDTVLIAGDISWAMRLEEAKIDFAELAKFPGRKIIIRGNHDYWWQSYGKINAALPPNIYAIQNNALKFEDNVFCGTRGWTMSEGKDGAESKKIWDRELLRLEMTLSAAAALRKDGDNLFVMLHYPPFEANLQDTAYTDLIAKFNPTAVVYGHLHGKNIRSTPVVDKRGVPYYLTSCDKLENKLLKII